MYSLSPSFLRVASEPNCRPYFTYDVRYAAPSPVRFLVDLRHLGLSSIESPSFEFDFFRVVVDMPEMRLSRSPGRLSRI